jgi:WD40 repeat protein
VFLLIPITRTERLIATLALGHDVKVLLGKGEIPKNISAYPAVSPLLALRTAVNRATQQSEFQVQDLSVSPDGKLVLAGDGITSKLYTVSGQKLTEFQGNDARFSPDSQKVVTNDDVTHRLYDFTRRDPSLVLPFRFIGVSPLRFSPDSQKVVIRDILTINVYDLSGVKRFELPTNLPPFSVDYTQNIKPDSSPSGLSTLGDGKGVFKSRNLVGQRLADFEDDGTPTFSHDGKNVVIGHAGKIWFYDLISKKPINFQGEYGRFSPDGKQLLTVADSSRIIRLYNLTSKKITEFPGKFQRLFPSFSPNGSQIITWDTDISRLYCLTDKSIEE